MSAFGLDLSDAWIRLALLEKRRKKLRLPVRGEIQVPPGAIVDGEIQNPQIVTDLLKQLTEAAGLHTHLAIMSLPERHTFIKTIAVAKDETTPMEQRIKNEAAQHLPYAWEDMYFDYHLMAEPVSNERQAVLIGASPKTLVDTYVKTAQAAGIEPIGLEIESLAIARAVMAEPAGPAAAVILDLGRTRSTLILVENSVVQFSATVRYAGKEMNQYIRDTLQITDEQAERAKRIFGLDATRGKGVLRKVLMPQMKILAAKVAEVETYYQQHFPSPQPIEKIFLTGSGALLHGIDQELSAEMEKSVILQPSWVYQNLLHEEPGLNPEIGYTYATAFGLSLLNFETLV